MPICRDSHWILVIMVPEERKFYCLDPDSKGIGLRNRPFHYKLLMSCGAEYDKIILSKVQSTPPDKKWTIEIIYHKHQPGSWECGYYCMLYMEKLCLLYAGVDMHEVFPHDMNPFPMDVIEGSLIQNASSLWIPSRLYAKRRLW